ncbi:MiAMP1 family antimicrobial peptide [Streptomyces sp. CT34]|uniref:MiAMP1 family antimicrobial peptide n=1 Tax=Streptomyces sp. CT34 TaxID=1553907 RepID=UPI0005BBCE3A|nr:MiAMP1 family antimicrobial peptide [Streptomyces sp. CT34]
MRKFMFSRRAAAVLVATAAIGGAVAAAPATAAESRPAGMTSSFVAYPGTSFTGQPVDINGCGLHDIPAHGSYKWIARGQSGRMYDQPGAGGPVHTVLASDENAEQSTPFGWQSIFIVC